MKSILLYIENMIPYLIICLPIYFLFRYYYVKKKLKGRYRAWHEILLSILVAVMVGVISQTIIPEFELINGKIQMATLALKERFNFIPFRIFYETYIEVVRYQNFSYLWISLISNICIFIPIGILLPLLYTSYKKWHKTLLFGISFSIGIEAIQIFLPRATDIDDVILNTFGTLLGFWIYIGIQKIFSTKTEKCLAFNVLDLIKEENKQKKRYAIVTGASYGLGEKMVGKLHALGFHIIAVARSEKKLKSLKQHYRNVEMIVADLSQAKEVQSLYEKTKNKEIVVVINNAGMGVFGEFEKTKLEEELKMIDLNIKCVHMLSKLYLQDMIKQNYGYLLNVSSSAAFMPSGPLMGTYYATKSYVLSLTNAIYEELKRSKSNVVVSSLCLGPTNTSFYQNAHISPNMKLMETDKVAEIAIKRLFEKKRIIIPGISNKILKFVVRFLPDRLLDQINYVVQKRKRLSEGEK